MGRVASASARLRAIAANGATRDLFEALEPAVAFDAATFQTFRQADPSDITFVGYNLPEAIRQAWLSDASPDALAVVAPLLNAAAGAVLDAAEHTPATMQQSATVFRSLTAHGFHHRMAVCLRSRALGRGDAEHRFLAVLKRTPFAPTDTENLGLLHDDIVRAVERLRLPFLSGAPILEQVVREQRYGYACVSTSGATVESNSAAHRLACEYLPAEGRSALDTMIKRAMSAHASCKDELALQIHHAARPSLLDVSVHFLDADAHDLPAPVHLVLLKEVSWSATPATTPATAGDPFAELTPRQLQVVTLLATTGDSYERIAEQLGVARGTIRKHVELAYRALGVHSRAELCVLWRDYRSGESVSVQLKESAPTPLRGRKPRP